MVDKLTNEELEAQLHVDYPPHILHHIAAKLNSRSPDPTYSSRGSPPGASDESSPNVGSRFDINFDFLKRNKDGDKSKRRGPKPDTKPALTRRQELNRQAQRTHRDRKERYVQGLEQEVNRLREAFTIITREKTQILEENRRLKELLERHKIPYNSSELLNATTPNSQYSEIEKSRSYDDIGIDFVLALESPCMQHMKFVTNGSVNNLDAEFHGHALMLSCPPESHNMHNPDIDWGLKTYDLPSTDLSKLFHLSNRLQLDGELTPIAVWATITCHTQFSELELADFEAIKQALLLKVTCHGFGAVVEENEVFDSLNHIFASRLGVTFVNS